MTQTQPHVALKLSLLLLLPLTACDDDFDLIGVVDAGSDASVADAAETDAATCTTPSVACPRLCTPVNITSMEVGRRVYAWDGSDCHGYNVDPAPCTGTLCSELFDDQDQCRARYRECIPPARVTANLVCGISEEEVVRAAIRLNACNVEYSAYVLRRYYSLDLALQAYSGGSWETTVDCDDMRCALAANSCEALEACIAPRRGADCSNGPTTYSCSGDALVGCERDANVRTIVGPQPAPHLRARGVCSVIEGGTCVVDGGARCVAPNPARSESGHLDYANGDDLVVATTAGSYRLRCADHIAGSVPRHTPDGYEDRCGYPDATCDEYTSGGSIPQCDGTRVTLCAGGHPHTVDCVAAGYSACDANRGCVP